MHRQYGDDGYEIARRWLENKRDSHGADTAKILASWRDVARFKAVQLTLGDQSFWSLLRPLAECYRRDYCPLHEALMTAVAAVAGCCTPLNELVGSEIIHTDMSIQDASVRRRDKEYILNCRVSCGDGCRLPTELAYVFDYGDTLFDTLACDDFCGKDVPLTRTFAHRPRAVVIDPRHQLPERSRHDNYCFFVPSYFRYLRPKTAFPYAEGSR